MAMMEYLTSIRGILKVAQMLLVVIALGTWFGVESSTRDFNTGTVFLAFFSALAIFTQNMLLAPSRVLEILMSAILGLFFFISGIIVLVEYPGNAVGETCGAFCFFCMAAYGADVFFTFQIETE